ncbi:MAG: hypothetical protein IT364_12860 [Candidatus Hydrogenedentes bacterium]|nr:hypothetical protein [Candidatus Hydrogenedentota bacterium]
MTITPEDMEPALSEALLRLRDPGGLAEAHAALRACRSLCELARIPLYEEYDPHGLLAGLSREVQTGHCTFDLARVGMCAGDTAQILAALRVFVEDAVLESDASLAAALVEEGQVPIIRFEFDGPGRFPHEFALKDRIPLSLEDVEIRWTAATRGGRIDKTSHGADLRLKGVRVVPETSEGFMQFVEPIREAERHLRLAAGGASDDVYSSVDVARNAVLNALAALDGCGRAPAPTNVAAVWQEVQDAAAPVLQEKAIAMESHVERQPPPIVAHRLRLQSAFSNILRHAAAALPNGGTVSCVLDYNAKTRTTEMLFSLEGSRYVPGPGHYVASARRSFTEIHSGTFDASQDATSAAFSATVPDVVGSRLDGWIPGWDALSERSCQMLRLLKGGGPTPPEDFLLGGILEEELERLLLPRLSVAPATTMAHDLGPQASPPKGSSPERLEKALGQIRKGKPKKEICKASYAAEIFWAFRSDARHRGAVGLDALDKAAVKALSTLLWGSPLDVPAVLRILTRAQCDTDRNPSV